MILLLVRRLGPGGIPFEMVKELVVDVNSPPDDPQALVCHAYDLGWCFNNALHGTIMTTPAVFDNGASGRLSLYKSDFIDYEPVKIEVKGVAGMGQVVSRGTTL